MGTEDSLALRAVHAALLAATAVLAVTGGACSLLETVPDVSSGRAGTTAADGAVEGDASATDGASAGDAPSGGDAMADGAPLSASARYAALVREDGPVAYYRLNETSGTVMRDDLNARPGTYGPACTLGVAGVFAGDGAVRVNAPGVAIKGPDIDFTGTQPFTFTMWASVPTLLGAATTQMFFQRNGNTGGRQQFGGYMRTGDGLVFERWVAGAEISPAIAAVTGRFIHLGFVYDGTRSRLYLDGAEVASLPDTRSQAAKSGPLVFGYDDVGVGTSHLEGTLDEIAIYDKVLPATRIAAQAAVHD